MSRSGTQWTARAGGLTETAATRAEAAAHIAVAVRGAIYGDYRPTIIASDGHSALLWREAGAGWLYAIDPEKQPGPTLMGREGGSVERGVCERLARQDLAQAVDSARRQRGEPLVGEHLLQHEADRQEHRRWAAWQQGYQDGKQAGLEDRQCRVLADLRQVGKEYTDAPARADFCYREGAQPFDLPPALQPGPVLGMRWNPDRDTVETEYADGHIGVEPSTAVDARLEGNLALQALLNAAARTPNAWALTPAGAKAHPAVDVAAVAARLRDAPARQRDEGLDR